MRVIDDEGNMIGVLPTRDAIAQARENELDLIEVNPKADPPVCKISNYGKLQYLKEKQLRKQKSAIKKVEVKGIRLSTRISEHDREVRLKQAKKFLAKGNKIKVEIILKGREHKHIDISKDIIHTFVEELGDEVSIEQNISKQGGKIFTILVPKKD